MGVWSFSKYAGKAVGPQSDLLRAADLQDEIVSLGLISDDIKVVINGDKVSLVGGMALSDEDVEKLVLAVGNIQGVAKVEADIAKEPCFYAIKAGETLSSIAQKCLGSRDRRDEVLRANQPLILDPETVFEGQVVRLPK